MDKKAYRDRLRSQDKRERTAASLGLPYSGRDLAIAFGLYLAAVLLCRRFLRSSARLPMPAPSVTMTDCA